MGQVEEQVATDLCALGTLKSCLLFIYTGFSFYVCNFNSIAIPRHITITSAPPPQSRVYARRPFRLILLPPSFAHSPGDAEPYRARLCIGVLHS